MKQELQLLHRKILSIFLLAALFFICVDSYTQTLAFPGAEGFGRFATGGRSGEIYVVTNLNDAGPGSFRDAVSKPNRIVVFAVGGVVKITSRVVVSPNITIAAQTAPGDGIVIYGNGLSFSSANNSIVRYLRIRMGSGGDSGKDAITIATGNNMIFDHVSVSWGRDETFSISGDVSNVTIQNSIISQGLETHSCGGLIQTTGGVSLFRNLYIDNNTRNPKVKGVNDFTNNIVYNWGVGGAYIMGDSEGPSAVNIINNYLIKGPSSSARPFSRGNANFVPYVEGNYYDSNLNGALDGSLVPREDYEGIVNFNESPYPYPAPANILSAQDAYDFVRQNAGAVYPRRDQVDAYVIDELLSLGTKGFLISKESSLPTKGPGDVFGAPAPLDTDKDGIPDAWEIANGLDPNNYQDGKIINPDGYTNLEKYINTLVSSPAPAFLRPPSGVVLNALSPTQIDLTWNDNSDSESTFVLERSPDGIAYAVIVNLPGNTTSYSDIDLTPNRTYYYRLKAISETEASVYSTVVSIKTPNIPSAPDTPFSPTPSHQSKYVETSGVELKWAGSPNTITYHVYFGEDASNLVKKADLTTPSYTISGLEENTLYYWRVDASNDLGITTGDVWSFTTIKSFPKGKVADYKLDAFSGAIVADSSIYHNDGEIQDVNDYSWVAGKTNNCIDIRNVTASSHIFIPHQDHLYFNKHSFAISLWVKAPAQTSQSYLIHKGTFARNVATGGTGKWFGIEIKDGKFRFAVDDDVTKSEVVANNPPFFTNEWVHVVVVRDTEKKLLKIYRNGFLEAEAADRTLNGIGETEPITIANSNDLNVPFKGMLDEIKIFNYGLSEMEVLELFHDSPQPLQAFDPTPSINAVEEGFDDVTLKWRGGVNTNIYKLYFGSDSNLTYLAEVSVDSAKLVLKGLAPNSTYFWRVDAIGAEGTITGNLWSFKTGNLKGLVGHWKLDETSGLVAHDNTDFQNNGALTGFPEASWSSEGKFAGSLNFLNPTNIGSVKVPHANHLLLDDNSFTTSLWVKIKANTYTSSNGKDCYLIHKGTFEANTGKWFGLQLRDGKLTFAIDDGITKTDLTITVDASSVNNIFNDEWKHLVIIRDTENKRMKIYINGVEIAQKAYTTLTIGRLTDLIIGNSTENKPFRDQMDDVRIYNYALSLSEIQSLYSGAPLVAKASNPFPADEAINLPADTIQLQWDGQAQKYTLYVGTAADSVEERASGISAKTFTLTGLSMNTTYFWRVDAIKDGEVAKGDLWSFVTQKEKVPPTVLTKNITLTLKSTGTVTITPADIDKGTNDASGIATLELDKATFGCADIGRNTVTLTATDNNGNTASATAIVTVKGSVPNPVIIVSRQDYTYTGGDANTIFLGYGAQKLNLKAINLGLPATYSWSPAVGLNNPAVADPVFTPTNPGEYTFTLTATSATGCIATKDVTIKVIDARCGNSLDKVVVCIKGFETCVSPSAVKYLLVLGNTLGKCTNNGSTNSRTMDEEGVEETIDIKVYPTPLVDKGTIDFNLTGAGKYKLNLYNLSGVLQKVIAQGVSDGNKPLSFLIDAHLYNPGLYVLELITDRTIVTKRIIIER